MKTPALTRTATVAAASPRAVWRDFLARVLAAGHMLETRRTLLEMDARMLKDIGITHADAIEEARRRPWDIEVRPRRRR
jgi:uncharacterized protein YjiS (DUF1127 family)